MFFQRIIKTGTFIIFCLVSLSSAQIILPKKNLSGKMIFSGKPEQIKKLNLTSAGIDFHGKTYIVLFWKPDSNAAGSDDFFAENVVSGQNGKTKQNLLVPGNGTRLAGQRKRVG